jgi:hypothetical protein
MGGHRLRRAVPVTLEKAGKDGALLLAIPHPLSAILALGETRLRSQGQAKIPCAETHVLQESKCEYIYIVEEGQQQ